MIGASTIVTSSSISSAQQSSAPRHHSSSRVAFCCILRSLLIAVAPAQDGQRALVLLSKIVQVLANGALFGEAHDSHMIKLNSYLLSQRPALREFVGKISTQSPSLEDEREEIQENFPLLEPLRTLAFYLHKHSDVIKLAFKNSTDVDEQASLQKLSDLLAQVTLEDDPAPIQDLQVEQKNFHLKIRRVISSTMSSRTDENHWFPPDVEDSNSSFRMVNSSFFLLKSAFRSASI